MVMAVALAMSGCSLLAVRGPRSRGMDCTSSTAAPILDTVATVAAAVAAGAVFTQIDVKPGSDGTPDPAGFVVAFVGVPMVVLAATYGISAAYGFVQTGKCRDYLKDEPERERVTALKRQALEAQLAEQERLVQRERSERERIEREAAERDRIQRVDRDEAYVLLRTATQAAGSGDCTTAVALGDQIRTKNLEVWSVWYMHDEQIKRCRYAAASPPVAPDAGVTP